MSRLKRYGSSSKRFCFCERDTTDIPVISGLSVTPSQVMEMTNQGISVSTLNSDLLIQGTPNPRGGVPLDESRGVDPAILWETSQDIKSRMRDGVKKDINKFG